MRLTLRTLLAYLDDTLEPAQAKVIGQKIAESPTAQELVERIREVVRRRRITTPPATGPGAKLDPNTVAEYIDSVLSPEQLAEVEDVCLNSDVHLAEIAACHQILTLILSEPALVPPTARQRMYGLARGREAIPYRKACGGSRARRRRRKEPGGKQRSRRSAVVGPAFLQRPGGMAQASGASGGAGLACGGPGGRDLAGAAGAGA